MLLPNQKFYVGFMYITGHSTNTWHLGEGGDSPKREVYSDIVFGWIEIWQHPDGVGGVRIHVTKWLIKMTTPLVASHKTVTSLEHNKVKTSH